MTVDWVINNHAIHDDIKVGTISEVGYITNKLTQRLKARQFLFRIFSTKIFFSTKMEKFERYSQRLAANTMCLTLPT